MNLDREEKIMANYRHRIFEMYEFRNEAIRALTPKSAHPVTEATTLESWTYVLPPPRGARIFFAARST